MSRRSQRNRRAVNYSEAAGDDEDATTQSPEEQLQQQQDKGRGRGRRGRADSQQNDDSQQLQPATQRATCHARRRSSR